MLLHKARYEYDRSLPEKSFGLKPTSLSALQPQAAPMNCQRKGRNICTAGTIIGHSPVDSDRFGGRVSFSTRMKAGGNGAGERRLAPKTVGIKDALP